MKFFKKVVFLLIVIFIIFAIVNFKEKENEQIVENGEETKISGVEQKEEVIKDTSINIAVIGDIMCHNTQFMDAENKATGTYDFSYVFEEVKDYMYNPDLTIGNLETTLAGKEVGYSGYPTFNTPEVLAQNLKDLGVDVLSTVNNHCLDKGFKGLKSTIDELDNVGIKHTGTFKTEEDSNEVLVVDVNGITMGIIAYTYGTNGIPLPKGDEYCVNLIDKDKIAKDIEKVKEKNVDMIIAIMHWGIEYQTTPNQEQKDLADFLFKNGVTLILGGHPHVLQKMEKVDVELDDGSHRDGFIVYSLGNFISGQVKENTKQSVILNIGLTKHGKTNEITVDDVTYVPVYMQSNNGTPRYILRDINADMKAYEENGTASGISAALYNTMKSENEHIYKIMGEEIHK